MLESLNSTDFFILIMGITTIFIGTISRNFMLSVIGNILIAPIIVMEVMKTNLNNTTSSLIPLFFYIVVLFLFIADKLYKRYKQKHIEYPNSQIVNSEEEQIPQNIIVTPSSNISKENTTINDKIGNRKITINFHSIKEDKNTNKQKESIYDSR